METLTITKLPDFRISNDVLENPTALRQRLDDDGYLFFRGLLDKDA